MYKLSFYDQCLISHNLIWVRFSRISSFINLLIDKLFTLKCTSAQDNHIYRLNSRWLMCNGLNSKLNYLFIFTQQKHELQLRRFLSSDKNCCAIIAQLHHNTDESILKGRTMLHVRHSQSNSSYIILNAAIVYIL